MQETGADQAMARPREFDTDDALDRAMEVFWTRGYEATSLRDLVAAMGISKSSLYDTFGSKHELFLAAIDRYNATVGSCHLPAIIESAPTPRRAGRMRGGRKSQRLRLGVDVRLHDLFFGFGQLRHETVRRRLHRQQ
jgi:AcrR family transcriptional regulator